MVTYEARLKMASGTLRITISPRSTGPSIMAPPELLAPHHICIDLAKKILVSPIQILADPGGNVQVTLRTTISPRSTGPSIMAPEEHLEPHHICIEPAKKIPGSPIEIGSNLAT